MKHNSTNNSHQCVDTQPGAGCGASDDQDLIEIQECMVVSLTNSDEIQQSITNTATSGGKTTTYNQLIHHQSPP